MTFKLNILSLLKIFQKLCEIILFRFKKFISILVIDFFKNVIIKIFHKLIFLVKYFLKIKLIYWLYLIKIENTILLTISSYCRIKLL